MNFILSRIALVLGFVAGLQILTMHDATARTIEPQGEIVPFVEKNWAFIGRTKLVEHKGQQALQLGVKKDGEKFAFGMAMLKRAPFTNGIIEYDVSFGQTRTFAGLRFRAQKAGNFENFYMRAHQSGNPDASQYMPNYNGIASWQLYYGRQYSAPASYSFNKWMHVKLVVSGKLADVYIDDMSKPAMTVELKRDEKTGGVGLWAFNMSGPAWFANFAIKPMDSVQITGTAVAEQPAHDGTVMNWQVSGSFDAKLIKGAGMLSKDLVAGLSFQPLAAGKTGLTNLARLQGVKKGKDTVFAKIVINSRASQMKEFEFGFSDRAKIYLNGQPLFSGSDELASRDYRFLGTVGYYDTVFLPLKSGRNELLIAVTEKVAEKGGWAIQGRFKDPDGVDFQ